MAKKIFTLTLLLVIFLAACQSSTTTPTEKPTQVIEESPTSEPTPSPTAPPLPESSPTATGEQSQVEGETYCTVVSRQSAPVPTEQSIVPPVDDKDWAHGSEDARVTIIEYGDFQ